EVHGGLGVAFEDAADGDAVGGAGDDEVAGIEAFSFDHREDQQGGADAGVDSADGAAPCAQGAVAADDLTQTAAEGAGCVDLDEVRPAVDFTKRGCAFTTAAAADLAGVGEQVGEEALQVAELCFPVLVQLGEEVARLDAAVELGDGAARADQFAS